MASQDIVQQLVNSVVSNPDLFDSLVQHPYSTVREATGKEEVSRDEVSQALAAVSLLGSGKPVDFGSLSDIASQLLAQNDGSAHAMAQSLLSEQSSLTPNPMDLIANLAKVDFSKGMAGVDLSDGLGIDDVIGFATSLLGGKK